MKKYGKNILAAVLVLLVIAGCVSAPAISAEVSGENTYFSEEVMLTGATPSAGTTDGSTTSSELETSEDVDASVSKRDVSGEYDASEATVLSADGDMTITEAGVYVLSGNYEGMILIDADDEDKVQIVLENATITNGNGPAIYVRSADKVFITASEGTVNTISDGTSYELTDGDTELDAAVFSKDDLTINGTGKLTINGNYKHAVVSKDDLIITAKDLSVNAENVGLNGKDSVKLSGAEVSISAGSDGIRSENGSETGKGFVTIVDSKLTIVSGKDSIQAETVFLAENAEISITAGGGSGARNSDTSESFKGIKAGVSVTIKGGVFQIDALDDAIHTNGSILIQNGEVMIQSRDDGIHANEKVEISGGTVKITAYEGIEGTYVLITNGEIAITASDDGINAAYKSSAYKPTVEITGGSISITMGAGDTDCIDSNGNLIISGGTLNLNGQSPFDYDGSATFTGGTVYVNGQEIDALYNQMMGGFGGKEAFGEFPGGMGGFGGEPGSQGGFGGEPGSQGGFGGAPGGHGGAGGPDGRP